MRKSSVAIASLKLTTATNRGTMLVRPSYHFPLHKQFIRPKNISPQSVATVSEHGVFDLYPLGGLVRRFLASLKRLRPSLCPRATPTITTHTLTTIILSAGVNICQAGFNSFRPWAGISAAIFANNDNLGHPNALLLFTMRHAASGRGLRPMSDVCRGHMRPNQHAIRTR